MPMETDCNFLLKRNKTMLNTKLYGACLPEYFFIDWCSVKVY